MILVAVSFSDLTNVYAVDDSGMWGDSINWVYKEATNTLIIGGDGEIPYTNQYYLHTRPWSAYSSKITNIVIEDGVTAIGDCAFKNCAQLTTIEIPESVVQIGGGAFYGCSSLTGLFFPGNVTEIGVCAFYGCTDLTSVNIPKTVKRIGDDTFYNCRSLTKLVLPDGALYNVNFSGCSSLKEITLPNSITTLDDYAFYNCTKLESVILSDSITEISTSSFRECKNLISVKLPERVSSIGNSAFYNCSSLSSVIFPESLHYIGDCAFQNCSALGAVVFPKQLSYLGNSAFYSCDALKYIDLPDSLTYMGDSAFSRCGSLTVVELSERLTAIPHSAFYSCSELESVLVSESVVLINAYAFYGCDALVNIFYGGTKEQWDDIVVHDDNDKLSGAELHCNSHCIHHIATTQAIDATCTEGGLTSKRFCYKCGEIFQNAEETAALGHAYKNGSCLRCGVKDPDYIVNSFTDVKESDWFFKPVMWAVNAKVTGGKTATTFAPYEGCTRAQVVTFLWAANGKPMSNRADSPFVDVKRTDWYYNAVLWAVENGITGGVSADKFGPNETCTRAQIATFLWAAEGKPAVDSGSEFSDVKDTDWFAAPVIWAKNRNITTGIGGGKFGPNDTCTRAQVVTFLNQVYQ